MRTPILLAALAAALVLPAAAAAKGPDRATISGPGVNGSLPITGDGEAGAGTPLGNLVVDGGYFTVVFGGTPDLRLKHRPTGDLGPRYTVVYRVPGPAAKPDRLVQYVYPYAKPMPVTFMPRGQRFWVDQTTRGGWVEGNLRLRRTLVRLGLPPAAPSNGGGFSWWTVATVAAGLLMLAVALRTMRRWTARSTSSTARTSA